MSGIVGIFQRDGRPVEREDLTRMVDILAHRGPDGAQVWCEEAVGLGHRMLHTTPESLHEQLPLVSRCGELVITADARIDNREELIPLLDLDHRPSLEVADSQVILAAYENWGEACPEKLLGDFAFAIWDKRRQKLFCARDHFGIKPFYYYAGERFFAFASEMKALLCLEQIPQELNEVWIAEYLVGIFDDHQATSRQHVFRLPPAYTMMVDFRNVKTQSYWSLDPRFELQLGSDEAYAEAFREIFTEAVRCRLRSHTPVGSMLSGGLDSSSIACTAERLLGQAGQPALRTFSAVYDDVPECDERPYIEAVLAQGDFEAHYLRGDQINPFGDIEQILWHQDQPYHAPGLHTRWKLLELAHSQGVRVLFDGFDGDSTVSHGFEHLQELAHKGRWMALARHMPRVAAAYDTSVSELFWHYLWGYRLGPVWHKKRIFRLSRRIWRKLKHTSGIARHAKSARAKRAAFLSPAFADRINGQLQQQFDSDVIVSERKLHHRALMSGNQPLGAETLDKAVAAFGIEMRYPFGDRRLVEFCLSIPPEQKLYQGWSRVILRRAMTGVVPSTIQWRLKKTNFLPNLRHSLLSFGREYMDEAIGTTVNAVDSYADVAAVRAAYAHFVTDTSYPDGRQLFAILRVILLALCSKCANRTSYEFR